MKQTPLGAIICELRYIARFTQEELAVRAGISPKTLASIERGSNFPADATIAKLAAALGVPVEELTPAPVVNGNLLERLKARAAVLGARDNDDLFEACKCRFHQEGGTNMLFDFVPFVYRDAMRELLEGEL